jgi:hypothetical protein
MNGEVLRGRGMPWAGRTEEVVKAADAARARCGRPRAAGRRRARLAGVQARARYGSGAEKQRLEAMVTWVSEEVQSRAAERRIQGWDPEREAGGPARYHQLQKRKKLVIDKLLFQRQEIGSEGQREWGRHQAAWSSVRPHTPKATPGPRPRDAVQLACRFLEL